MGSFALWLPVVSFSRCFQGFSSFCTARECFQLVFIRFFLIHWPYAIWSYGHRVWRRFAFRRLGQNWFKPTAKALFWIGDFAISFSLEGQSDLRFPRFLEASTARPPKRFSVFRRWPESTDCEGQMFFFRFQERFLFWPVCFSSFESAKNLPNVGGQSLRAISEDCLKAICLRILDFQCFRRSLESDFVLGPKGFSISGDFRVYSKYRWP